MARACAWLSCSWMAQCCFSARAFWVARRFQRCDRTLLFDKGSTLRGLRCDGHRRPRHSPHQPNNQSQQSHQHHQREPEHQKQPSLSAKIGDIPADHRRRIAAKPPSKDSDVARELNSLVKAHVSAKRSRVAVDLPVILNHDTPTKRSHVAQDMPAHSHAACETCHVRRLFSGPDADTVPELCAVPRTVRERGTRKRSSNNDAGEYH